MCRCVEEIAKMWVSGLESVCDGEATDEAEDEAIFFLNISSPPGGCMGGAPTQSDFFFYFYLAP